MRTRLLRRLRRKARGCYVVAEIGKGLYQVMALMDDGTYSHCSTKMKDLEGAKRTCDSCRREAIVREVRRMRQRRVY